MTQRKEHSWNEWDYENRCTPVWVMMLTSASCCSHVPFLCVKTQTSVLKEQHQCYVIDMSERQINMSSTREDVIRRRHVLYWCADSSLNHEWSKTASFISYLDACLDAIGVRPPLHLLSYCLLRACFLPGLLFGPENGGNVCLRNIDWLSPS
jgi:hypothetical protein